MKIEMIPIEKLTGFARNSKIHTKKQIEHIANSVREFGFNDPLAIAGPDNVILEGNGRIEAARLLGMTQLPCIRLDHLNESEQRAYVIAHNALCLETGFDEAALFGELEALKDYDFRNYGLDCDKFDVTLDKLQQKKLAPIASAHYLVSVAVDHNDKIAGTMATLRGMEGVQVRAASN